MSRRGRGGVTDVEAAQHGQVEGQQLQGDDAEDALETVHTVGHLDGAARVLHSLVVVLVTDDDGPALFQNQTLLR